MAELAHDAGAKLVVDNTFCSPHMLKPLDFGAEVVVQSATKYLNGHSDVIAGCVSGSAEVIDEIQRRVITLGGSLDPHAAYLLWRGLQTFPLRLQREHATAQTLAAAFDARGDIRQVIYPGLVSHPHASLQSDSSAKGRGEGW